MKESKKYKEIFKLHKMLEEANIEHEFYDQSLYKNQYIHHFLPQKMDWEKYQIIIRKNGERLISVIEGFGTYGRDEDLLEIMGCLTEEELEENEVKGWLTAEEVFKRIITNV